MRECRDKLAAEIRFDAPVAQQGNEYGNAIPINR